MSKWSSRRSGREEGRTLVEMLMAITLAVLIGIALAGLQGSTRRWDQADRNSAAALRPIRDSMDYLSSDIRLASAAECCAQGRLTLHIKAEPDFYQVSYWLDGDQLKRSIMLDYNPSTLTTRTVVRGLTQFTPSLNGSRVRIVLAAQSPGPKPVTHRIETELVPTLGVIP